MGNSQPASTIIRSKITDNLAVSDAGNVIPVTHSVCNTCRVSFKLVTKDKGLKSINRHRHVKVGGSTGVHEFYSEFYDRLMMLNPTGFDSIIKPTSSQKHQSSMRGAILMRIVRFVLNVQSENEETIDTLRALGKSHAKRGICSEQNSTFINVLFQTVAQRLGNNATDDTMKAWYSLLKFIVIHMNQGCNEYLATLSSEASIINEIPSLEAQQPTAA